ncbi:tRNAHis-5'-guanylyltransferase [Caulobacter phage C1]|nr:tRNAHis-5'-guanylyltransferase [Caulobacter phage C1]UTU08560.1 hypothetical protein CcrC2_gp332 [Caulobacter phage C2]UTU09076.1 hypothetical protein CcrJ4_gp327 [Caulobacter phage J4]UTU09635.1 hypothetical protein CcrBL47_gp349 [Caulobacter phage BL47]UTU10193.1 tRNAHis-5'-guanylyltransferase [Caulobacter phage RB23]WGN97227.1 tRNAHis-5'-guanylyltransferase [Bertelyvirus sp.]
MTETKDALGDRMKAYEKVETGRRFMPGLPVIVRLDGHGFSRFTKGLQKPFDMRMVAAMAETTKALVEKTHARLGYTQSDEITLVFMPKDDIEQYFFAGKVFKMKSVLAGLCSTLFYRNFEREWLARTGDAAHDLTALTRYLERNPHFDARAFQVPVDYEAANAVLWRVKDAERNAVQMAAQSLYSQKQLHKLSTETLRRKIAEGGLDFDAYPRAIRSGSFFQSVTELRPIPPEALERMKEKDRPADGMMRRASVQEVAAEGPVAYRTVADLLGIVPVMDV